LLCEGGKAEVHSSWYRCLDGVAASSPSIMPMATQGMPDIFVVIGLTTLIYGSGLFVIGLVAKLVMGSSKS
jgi:hypothetical protein